MLDFNATQAAIRAGYSQDTARQMGAENLSKPVIAEAIQALVKKRSERTQVKAGQVVAELVNLAFVNIYDLMRVGDDGNPYTDLSNLTPEQATAISEFTVADFKVGRGEDARQSVGASDYPPFLSGTLRVALSLCE